jgi:hypothetical protein
MVNKRMACSAHMCMLASSEGGGLAQKVVWAPLLLFLVISMGATWVLVAGAFVFTTEQTPWLPVVALGLSMWTPGVAAVVCSVLFEGRAGVLKRLGLGVPAWRPWLAVSALGSLIAVVVTVG